MSEITKAMIKEFSELDEKAKALDAFIKSKEYQQLGDEQKDLLNAQYHSIRTSQYILGRRIDLAMSEEN